MTVRKKPKRCEFKDCKEDAIYTNIRRIYGYTFHTEVCAEHERLTWSVFKNLPQNSNVTYDGRVIDGE